MNRKLLLVAAAALAITPAFAQTAGQTPPAEPTFTPEGVRAHVEFLADDLLEGRNAGTRGYDLAARYVATRFLALGLKPGGTDGSWYQQVPLAQYQLNAAKPSSMTIGGTTFANGGDVMIGASAWPDRQSQTIAVPAVFAGFGIDSPEMGRNDYAGLDVKGKIVVVLGGAPAGSPPGTAPQLLSKRAKWAEQHGAIGLITVMTPDLGANLPWPMLQGFLTRPQMTWIGPDGKPNSSAPNLQISAFVNGKAAEAMFAGAPGTLTQVLAQAGKKRGKVSGFALPASVSIARESQVNTVNSPNVIGVLPGSDPRLANEFVVLMAHLDHDGVDPKLTGDQIYNGAMDNAAGTATMLEAARAFAESGVRPRRSILFVAVTAEEDGLLGSEYLARHPVVGPNGKIVGVVNLDMPVLLYDFKDVVAFGAEHSTLGPIVQRATAQAGVTLSPDPMPQENLFVRSDHYSFVKAGVPSVFLVTGFQNGGEAAFQHFLKTDYHKVTDQTNLPFNWDAGAKFAKINYLIAREIANSDAPPLWYEGVSYADQFAKGQPRAPKPAVPVGTTAPAAPAKK